MVKALRSNANELEPSEQDRQDDSGDGSGELPDLLASITAYLGDDIDNREFVPTAEFIDALDVDPATFSRDTSELGCRPTRQYVSTSDGTRRVRGYLTADIRAAVHRETTKDNDGDVRTDQL